jgi:hypothetical protein
MLLPASDRPGTDAPLYARLIFYTTGLGILQQKNDFSA